MRNKIGYVRRALVSLLTVAGLIIWTTPFLISPELASAQTSAPSWTFTGSLNTARADATATLLLNGKVLVAGGINANGLLASAELYDPSTGTWSPTGSLNAPRAYHSATLLQNGKVLFAGGYTNNCCQESAIAHTAELYDPGTGTWSLTGNLNVPRSGHTAALLSNGKVLFAGGSLGGGAFSATNTAELYDPPSGTWSLTGILNGTRVWHTATLLRDGKVLAVGGCGDEECFFELSSAELYDPNTGAWSYTGGLHSPRYGLSVTITLPNGNVLVAGGADPFITNSAELYDPATERWSYTGSLLSRRYGATATLLPGGQALVGGGEGYDADNPGHEHIFNSAELYDPATGTWHATASLNTARTRHAAALLPNGKVLVVGGSSGFNNVPLQSAELYDSGVISAANPIDDPQFFVRQHYSDFLGREPDAEGFAFWTNEIISCGADAQCVEAKRVNVSAAFFLSIEFQQTGYLVYRMYKAAYGDMPGTPVPLTRQEFLPDTQHIGQGVVVGATGWEQALENNKNAFASEFVARSRFTTAFPQGMTPEQFVDALNANAGGVLSQGERDQLVSELASGAKSRAQILRSVAENSDLTRNEFNKAFVLMQYFGYLRRNPNDLPDTNFDGHNFWLNKLNQFNGNFIPAEMVKAFLTSIEYRRRFGP